MGVRAKILSGFLILAIMLFLAGVWSIYELSKMGGSVQRLLDENYKSIDAAKLMTEALERQDSAVLLLFSGNWKEGREIIKSADLSFQRAFQIAKNNVTIEGEKAIVDEIEKAYRIFKDLWEKPIVETEREGNMNWYFQEVNPSFLAVKLAVEKLMALNDKVMYQTASNLKGRAHRAVMPGVVAILSALIFTLLFNYFVNHYLVSPIIKITEEIQKCLKTGEPFQVEIETKDELSRLTSALEELVRKSGKQEAS